MNYFPKHFGGNRPDPEAVKRDGWRGLQTLVINVNDIRLTWPERELVRQLGDRLYGEKQSQRDKAHA